MTAELWVELIRALTWPITTVLLVLLFKKNILSIGAKLGKIRYGDFEAEFRNAIEEQTPVERQVSIEASQATEDPAIDSVLAGRLEGLALNEVESEFGELVRHVAALKRQDLTFDGVVFNDSGVVIFEVIITGDRQEVPYDHFAAVESRFKAFREAARDRNLQGQAKLIFLIVTSLRGESYISFEKKLRSRFERSPYSDVRLYSKDVLLERSTQAVDG